jgi:hypothetical protein
MPPKIECMDRKPEDVLAAGLLSLWAVAVAPGWSPALRLLNDNGFLAPISGLIGIVQVGTLFLVTVGSLGLAAALLVGLPAARFQAFLVGVMSALGGLMALASGSVSALADSPWALGVLVLALVGGPAISTLMLKAGISLPRPGQRRQQHPAPWSPPSPVPPVPPGPPGPGTPTAEPETVGGSKADPDGYWVRVDSNARRTQ